MDRLRAKKPVTDIGEWYVGFISEILTEKSNVELKNGVTLELTPELLDLFRSRLESEEKGAKIWYKKKK
jgi:hypothetical protein